MAGNPEPINYRELQANRSIQRKKKLAETR